MNMFLFYVLLRYPRAIISNEELATSYKMSLVIKMKTNLSTLSHVCKQKAINKYSL
jgi:hypothetical protein